MLNKILSQTYCDLKINWFVSILSVNHGSLQEGSEEKKLLHLASAALWDEVGYKHSRFYDYGEGLQPIKVTYLFRSLVNIIGRKHGIRGSNMSANNLFDAHQLKQAVHYRGHIVQKQVPPKVAFYKSILYIVL